MKDNVDSHEHCIGGMHADHAEDCDSAVSSLNGLARSRWTGYVEQPNYERRHHRAQHIDQAIAIGHQNG